MITTPITAAMEASIRLRGNGRRVLQSIFLLHSATLFRSSVAVQNDFGFPRYLFLLVGVYTSQMLFNSRGIPKGFWPKAQGCEERATLGNRRAHLTTPKGLWPKVARVRIRIGRNRFAVGDFLPTMSRGSSCLATPGWRSQSLWD